MIIATCKLISILLFMKVQGVGVGSFITFKKFEFFYFWLGIKPVCDP